MIGNELAIQQFEPTRLQPRHQPCQSHFRGVGFPAEHAFPEKGAPQGYSIESAHQPVARPAFDAMGVAHLEKGQARVGDRSVDPAFRPVRSRLRASRQHCGKIPVGRDLELVGPDGLAQRTGNMQSLQRQDRPFLGFHPEDFRIIPAVGHGKYPHRIGPQQDIEIDGHWRKGKQRFRRAPVGG